MVIMHCFQAVSNLEHFSSDDIVWPDRCPAAVTGLLRLALSSKKVRTKEPEIVDDGYELDDDEGYAGKLEQVMMKVLGKSKPKFEQVNMQGSLEGLGLAEHHPSAVIACLVNRLGDCMYCSCHFARFGLRPLL